MKKQARFKIGSSVFTCSECGRKTRNVDQGTSWLCPQCDERTATINGIMDGCYTSDPVGLAHAEARINELRDFVKNKGGQLK